MKTNGKLLYHFYRILSSKTPKIVKSKQVVQLEFVFRKFFVRRKVDGNQGIKGLKYMKKSLIKELVEISEKRS